MSIAAIGQESVSWVNKLNTSSFGNEIKKIGSNGWNGTGHSSKLIEQGVGGYVEFSLQNSSSTSMWGLNNSNTTSSYSDLNYAFYFNWGKVYLIENGAHVMNGAQIDISSISGNDKFKIEVLNNGVVKYYHNDVLIFTSNKLANSDLFVDCSIFHTNMSMKANMDLPSHTWGNLTNTNVAASKIIKTGGGNSWNGTGNSIEKIGVGVGGSIEFTLNDKSSTSMWGLNENNTSTSYSELNYAFYFNWGKVYLIENGNHVMNGSAIDIPNISKGDRFRIEVTSSNVVNYYHNEDHLFTSPTLIQDDVFFDCSIYYEGMNLYVELDDEPCNPTYIPITLEPTSITANSFNAKWRNSECSDRYRLQVSNNPTFDSYLINEGVIFDDFYFVDLNESPYCTFYYRVKSYSGDEESEFSETIMVDRDLSSFILYDTYVVNTTSNSFGVIFYSSLFCETEIDVSMDFDFNTSVSGYPKKVSSNLITITDLSSGCDYFYRLRKNGSNSSSQWSQTRKATLYLSEIPSALDPTDISYGSFTANFTHTDDCYDYIEMRVDSNPQFYENTEYFYIQSGSNVNSIPISIVGQYGQECSNYFQVRSVKLMTEHPYQRNSSWSNIKSVDFMPFPPHFNNTLEYQDGFNINLKELKPGTTCRDYPNGWEVDVSLLPNFSSSLAGYPLLIYSASHMVTGLAPNTYYYRARSKNGLTYGVWSQVQGIPIGDGNSRISKNTDSTTVVTKVELIAEINIYPNPADESVTVELSQATSQPLDWKVFDQTGREVLDGHLNRGEKMFDINASNLPSGIYMIHLYNDQVAWNPQRLVIIHK